MMKSVVKAFGSGCLGVIMTGMGRDGADGCRAIRAAGGIVLGQDAATSEVYGMNKVAFEEENVDRQFALPEAAAAIACHIRRLRTAARRPRVLGARRPAFPTILDTCRIPRETFHVRHHARTARRSGGKHPPRADAFRADGLDATRELQAQRRNLRHRNHQICKIILVGPITRVPETRATSRG